jgi:hypothetical protein
MAILDYVTGPELSFSIFYLVPVSLVTWYAGREKGIIVAIASAVAWLAVDSSTRWFSNQWVHFWNAFARLGFFLIVVFLLSRVKVSYEEQSRDLKIVQGLIPICAWCKKVRDDRGFWRQVETDHSGAVFSHAMCPACAKKFENQMPGK